MGLLLKKPMEIKRKFRLKPSWSRKHLIAHGGPRWPARSE